MKANQTSELPEQIPFEGKPTSPARRAFSAPNLSIGWFRSFAASISLLLASMYGVFASSASAQMMDISVNPTTVNLLSGSEACFTINYNWASTSINGDNATITATLPPEIDGDAEGDGECHDHRHLHRTRRGGLHRHDHTHRRQQLLSVDHHRRA